MNDKLNSQRCKLGITSFSTITLNNCLDTIDNKIRKGDYNYICVADARTMYWANKNDDLKEIQNNSLLSVPDGMSLVNYAKKTGVKSIERITGHDLMLALFNESSNKLYSHYFYGNTPGTLEKLKSNLLQKYPSLNIKGLVSPPFQELSRFNIDEIADNINKIKPTFFWCGLGSPKQERFIALLQPKLKSTICIAVGQAFAFVAEIDKRAPKWMQEAGLEWFYLYTRKPNKLIKAIIPYTWMSLKLIKATFSKKK